uniref:Uncharacterized protein n=1 Tax=Glossina brevipalpis TaxID=37001 RepID=A0A1A9VZN6_9MUSC
MTYATSCAFIYLLLFFISLFIVVLFPGCSLRSMAVFVQVCHLKHVRNWGLSTRNNEQTGKNGNKYEVKTIYMEWQGLGITISKISNLNTFGRDYSRREYRESRIQDKGTYGRAVIEVYLQEK